MPIKPQSILSCAAILGVPAACFAVGGVHETDLLLLGFGSLFVAGIWIYFIVNADLRYRWDHRRSYQRRVVVPPQWCSCRSGTPLQGWRCLVCRKPVATWRLQPRLLPRRPSVSVSSEWDPATAPPPPRPGPAPLLPTQDGTLAAAATLVQSARIPVEEQSEAATSALADPSATRRLYVTAAHRLHPDHNGGVHLPEWFALQSAMELLRRYHEAQAHLVST